MERVFPLPTYDTLDCFFRLTAIVTRKFVTQQVMNPKSGKNISRPVMFWKTFVPLLDMGTKWTDEMLYKRYGITDEEIAFIESKIHPMEVESE
jgi:site-specific DNA-methyltransferase (adenine-specific)